MGIMSFFPHSTRHCAQMTYLGDWGGKRNTMHAVMHPANLCTAKAKNPCGGKQ